MFSVPPGIIFVAAAVFRAGAVTGVVYALQRFHVLRFPAWASWLALPAYLIIKPLVVRFLRERERKRLGGAPIPTCKGAKWGNYDLLQDMLFIREFGYWGENLTKLVAQYGFTYNFRILGDDQIFTGEPENVKAILATDFPSFEKGSKFWRATNSMLGSGVFNADGDMWKFHRSISRPFFNRERVADFMTFAQHSDTAISLMLSRARAGYPVELQDLTGRFTLDSATDFLFGTCVNSLESELPYPGELSSGGSKMRTDKTSLSPADEFIRAFNEAEVVISDRIWIGGTWPLFEFWKDRIVEPMKVINTFIDPILKQALAKKNVRKTLDDESEHTTLLDHLVTQTDDTKIIKDEIMNIIVAGRDTTSATLSYFLYFMTMHPDVLKKLREEVLRFVGPTAHPTYDDLRDMKYLRAAVNETLRLMPPVPVNIRQTVRAVLLPSKDEYGRHHYIPPHTSISYSPWYMHRRKDLWGPDAEEFDPNRFIDERVSKYLVSNPFIFLPFNAGPRICLGQQFAYNEVSYFLVRMIQRVKALELVTDVLPCELRVPVEWAMEPGRKGMEQVRPASHLTLYAKGGIWVKIQEA